MSGFLNPKEILKQLDLREDMIAADFGCGSGGWVLPLAKILNKGKVYAVDVQQEMLSALKDKAETERIFNIEIVRKNVEDGTGLKENSADIVIISNILFQSPQKKEILSEAKNVIKSDGKILVVDWLPGAKIGPKEERVSPEDVKEMAKDLGLVVNKEFPASDYHWGLIIRKN